MGILTRRVTLFLAFAAIFIASFYIFRGQNSQMFCSYTDPLICDFLSKIKDRGLNGFSGTYEETFNGKKNSVVTWSLQGKDMEIIHKNPVEEQMHFILKGEKVYLRDYKDQRWWEQSLREMEKYKNQLPFDPMVFQNNFKEMLLDENLKITQEKEDICLGEECVKYFFVDQNGQRLKTTFYVSKATALLRRVEEDAEVVTEISFFTDKKDILPPDLNIKKAPTGTNIFLMNFLERSEKIQDKPDYIKEIEENLNESTSSAAVQGINIENEF